MASKPYRSEPYENDLDQVIQAGDPILIITTQAHSVNVAKGKYLGWRGTNSKNANVVVEKHLHALVKRHKETNAVYDYLLDATKLPHPGWFRHVHYENSWGRGPSLTPEQKEENRIAYEAYERKRKAYEEDQASIDSNYHLVKEPYTRRSTLQCNRIYAINTSLDDLIEKI